MRLIDADALKADYGMKDDCADCEKELHGKVRSCEYDHIYSKMDFCGWIDDAPTIDAVPVIRCEDCKYSSDNGVYGCRIEPFNYDFDTQMYANDFCSCGKRRSNG